ncbi:FAD-dependent monooxygenase [Mycolicibacterium goodii]|uniref:FAD-dependent oxidoreductase n=1 Tax=Mycolicibacterium goodii TaxID=134601 RepID=UPI001BDCBE4D|nr:FAD-dependent monooxygenase [Mycolicibacterium goodii]MBU8820845.1 FAD-dependent monooxygenase [Mycolicibacterium goodii]
MGSSMYQHGHAVIIGASVAGLMAAGAARHHFERVTVVERDDLPTRPVPRKGVPQGSQIHVLLPIGLEYMERVYPSIRCDFLASGCHAYDELADIAYLTEVGWRQRVRSAEGIGFRRPVLELAIRRRLSDAPNVAFHHGSVRALTATDDGSRITGVVLGDETTLTADFVVNATGRRTQVTKWLSALGFEAPRESYLNAYMGYATGASRGVV